VSKSRNMEFLLVHYQSYGDPVIAVMCSRSSTPSRKDGVSGTPGFMTERLRRERFATLHQP
jgi:hypothetical protein